MGNKEKKSIEDMENDVRKRQHVVFAYCDGLQIENIAAGEVMQTVTHDRFDKCIGGFTGAMAGVEFRRGAKKTFGSALQGASVRILFRVKLHEMKSAQKDIGIEPLNDVHHALVGTPAEDDFPSVFADGEILFVEE